jgi:hypothetical protein
MVSCIVRRRLLVATWGCLPAHLCGAVYGRLVVGGVLGGDTAQLLERAPKEVALSTLPWGLLVATRQRTWSAQEVLATSLGLIVLFLPRP